MYTPHKPWNYVLHPVKFTISFTLLKLKKITIYPIYCLLFIKTHFKLIKYLFIPLVKKIKIYVARVKNIIGQFVRANHSFPDLGRTHKHIPKCHYICMHEVEKWTMHLNEIAYLKNIRMRWPCLQFHDNKKAYFIFNIHG